MAKAMGIGGALLCAAAVVYGTWWGVVYWKSTASIRELQAKAERTLVVGTDRQAIEQFFQREAVEYRYAPSNPIGSSGHALIGTRVVQIPALGVVARSDIIAVLDGSDHLTKLAFIAPIHGP